MFRLQKYKVMDFTLFFENNAAESENRTTFIYSFLCAQNVIWQ
jgi:hypothetical protein